MHDPRDHDSKLGRCDNVGAEPIYLRVVGAIHEQCHHVDEENGGGQHIQDMARVNRPRSHTNKDSQAPRMVSIPRIVAPLSYLMYNASDVLWVRLLAIGLIIIIMITILILLPAEFA